MPDKNKLSQDASSVQTLPEEVIFYLSQYLDNKSWTNFQSLNVFFYRIALFTKWRNRFYHHFKREYEDIIALQDPQIINWQVEFEETFLCKYHHLPKDVQQLFYLLGEKNYSYFLKKLPLMLASHCAHQNVGPYFLLWSYRSADNETLLEKALHTKNKNILDLIFSILIAQQKNHSLPSPIIFAIMCHQDFERVAAPLASKNFNNDADLFVIAAQYGNLSLVKMMLENNPSLILSEGKSYGTLNNTSALTHHKKLSQTPTATRIFTNPAGTKTALVASIQSNQFETVKFLLDKLTEYISQSTDIISELVREKTKAFECAIFYGHLDIVKLFEITELSKPHHLYKAIVADRVAVLHVLSPHIAINSTMSDDHTLLHCAVNHNAQQCIHYLAFNHPELFNKGRMVVKNPPEFQPDYLPPLIEFIINQQQQTAKLLINLGADLKASTMHKNRLAIHYAAYYHQLELVQLLIKKDPSLLNACDTDRATPLHFACRIPPIDNSFIHYKKSQLSVIKFLLSQNHINVNAEMTINKSTNVTPLHIATSNGLNKVSFELIHHGAIVNDLPFAKDAITNNKVKKQIHLIEYIHKREHEPMYLRAIHFLFFHKNFGFDKQTKLNAAKNLKQFLKEIGINPSSKSSDEMSKLYQQYISPHLPALKNGRLGKIYRSFKIEQKYLKASKDLRNPSKPTTFTKIN